LKRKGEEKPAVSVETGKKPKAAPAAVKAAPKAASAALPIPEASKATSTALKSTLFQLAAYGDSDENDD
jgi:hypothetical protein